MQLFKLCFVILLLLTCISINNNIMSNLQTYQRPLTCIQDCCEIHCKQHTSHHNSCIQACNSGLSIFNKKIDNSNFTNCKRVCKQI